MTGARRRMKRHVVIIIQNLPLRLDRRVRNECQALLDAGYDVSVICPKAEVSDPAIGDLEGVRVYSYAAPEAQGRLSSYVVEFMVCWLQAARLTLKVHRYHPFDVIQACNPPDTYWVLGSLWKLRGRRFVFDQHDLCPEVYEARFGRRGMLHRLLLLLEWCTYRAADRVISPNPTYQAIAVQRGKVSVESTAVVMSSPDPVRMKRGAAHPELRGGLQHLVCYIGIMGPQDGVDCLVDAIETFVHDLGRRDTRFALLGYGESLLELQAACTNRGLDPWVTFTGRVDHDTLGRWLSIADLGVTPDPPNDFNDRSTMNKTLEYMAHGIAVVATNLSETRRCAGSAARYVSGRNPLETARAIADLLDDRDARERMGNVGRQRIENDLAWSRQAANYVGIFHQIAPIEGPLPVALPPNNASSQEQLNATRDNPHAVGNDVEVVAS